jgi:membrane protease YdiL (CAAX protease family)
MRSANVLPVEQTIHANTNCFGVKQLVTEKPWPLETVFRMLMFLMLSFAGALLVVDLTDGALKQWPKDRLDVLNFILGLLGFQGATLGWAVWLMRSSRLDATTAFGLGSAGIKRGLGIAFGGGVALTVIALPIGWVVGTIMTAFGFPPEAQAPVKLLEAANTLPKQILIGGTAIFLAPAAEEVLFRGILYPTLKQLGYPRLAYFGISILFGIIHFNWMALIPLTVVALLLTWLYEETGDLLVPIAAHSTFNLINVMLLTAAPWASQ